MLIIFFILGLIIGSFLNVVVYRLELAESILGRSRCPHCKALIRWYDNIPLLSFILLRARCRSCGGKISWMYPVVEFLTGVIFALTGYYFFISSDFQAWLETILYLGAFSALIVIMVYDFKLMEIPLIVVWCGVLWTAFFFFWLDKMTFAFAGDYFSLRLVSGALAGALLAAFFFSLAYYSHEKWMGLGDGYAGFLAGFLVGWPLVWWALVLSFTLGTIYAIIAIGLGRKNFKSRVPFAPFLIAGTIISILATRAFPEIKGFLMM